MNGYIEYIKEKSNLPGKVQISLDYINFYVQEDCKIYYREDRYYFEFVFMYSINTSNLYYLQRIFERTENIRVGINNKYTVFTIPKFNDVFVG